MEKQKQRQPGGQEKRRNHAAYTSSLSRRTLSSGHTKSTFNQELSSGTCTLEENARI